MALDWGNADIADDGTVNVFLQYGHVEFGVVPKPDGWIVQVYRDGVTVWSDDHNKEPDEGNAKTRAEEVYSDQAAAWCCMDMLAELLANK